MSAAPRDVDRGLGERATLAVGLVGIVTFAGAMLSVTWLPARLDVLLGLASIGVATFACALALAPR